MRSLAKLAGVAIIAALCGVGGYMFLSKKTAVAEPLPPPTAEAKTAAAASTHFGIDLFAKLRQRPGNLLISPYSIHTAMAMATEGAAGPTADELNRALHIDDKVRNGQQKFHARLRSPGKHGFELAVANRIWADKKFTLAPDYQQQLARMFLSDLERLDFSNPNAAADAINAWVSDRTHKRIPTILTADNVQPPTVVVLTNALYFKGDWDHPFKRSATLEGDFFTAPGKKTRAMLMNQKEKHDFADLEADGNIPAFRALSMKYTGGDLSMLLLLPELGELEKLETALTPELLEKVVRHLHETRLPVTLPRFKAEDSSNHSSKWASSPRSTPEPPTSQRCPQRTPSSFPKSCTKPSSRSTKKAPKPPPPPPSS
jgi:serpin B